MTEIHCVTAQYLGCTEYKMLMVHKDHLLLPDNHDEGVVPSDEFWYTSGVMLEV